MHATLFRNLRLRQILVRRKNIKCLTSTLLDMNTELFLCYQLPMLIIVVTILILNPVTNTYSLPRAPCDDRHVRAVYECDICDSSEDAAAWLHTR